MKISKSIRLLFLTATVLLTVLVFASLSEAENPNRVNDKQCMIDEYGCYRCKLQDCDFSNVEWKNFNLSKADLSRAKLNNANLSEAKLIDAKLNNADLTGANFSKANLTKANLSGAKQSGTNFTNAITDGAIGIESKESKDDTTPSPSPSH
ncbi:MAG: pentapeptide repeat-containing protein [Nostoc sp.]|uniref:pentapeptide repeat-containing protein n=1 Tax=Nostoc sp. TaxID=1180 RepID=UPI002FF82A3D